MQAIGFDWTYDYLSQPAQATQKQAIIDGMVTLGMVPFQRAYNDSTNSEYWWVSDVSNWCVVTNSGAGMAALALIGENNVPSWVESQILPTAIAGVTASATRPVDVSDGFGSGYEDDGVWWEGPIYHGYASRYFVPFVWSLLSATGGDAGLLAAPGVNYTAFYQSHAMDAAYQYFNWADAEAGQETLAMLLGIADKNGDGASAFTLRWVGMRCVSLVCVELMTMMLICRPCCSRWWPGSTPFCVTTACQKQAAPSTCYIFHTSPRRSRLEASPPPPNDVDNGANQMEWANALMYYTPIGTQSDRDAWALDSAFPRKKLAFFRSSWSDPDATFVGLKAGNCSWNHGDQDSGQLVYSTNGVRWICDLGADNYDLPNYFGSPPERYKWYRKNSLGHNVLSFNGQRQSLNCTGTATNLQSFSSTDGQVIAAPSDQPLIPCSSTPGQDACASIDLISVYSDPEDGVSRVSRSFYFRDGRTSLTVSDRWTASAAGSIVNVTSNFHTMAQVNISSDGLSAVLTSTACVSPSTCTVTVSVAPSSPCAAGTDVRVEAVQVRLAAPQDPSEGLTRVQFVIGPSAATCGGLDIIIAPGTA